MKKIPLPALLACLICSGGICWAISITVTGDWPETINSMDLQDGAGSDLISTYESANTIYIDITASGSWKVVVKKDDTTWHNNLHLHVKRTSDGTGTGGISGGGTYQEVTTNQDFFSGSLDRSAITVQLMLTGVSIQVPPGAYETTVSYTVLDYP
jgi:hypothetical protein